MDPMIKRVAFPNGIFRIANKNNQKNDKNPTNLKSKNVLIVLRLSNFEVQAVIIYGKYTKWEYTAAVDPSLVSTFSLLSVRLLKSLFQSILIIFWLSYANDLEMIVIDKWIKSCSLWVIYPSLLELKLFE